MGDERQSYPEAEERGGGAASAGTEQPDAPPPATPSPDGAEAEPSAIETFDEEGAGIASKE